MWVVDNNFNEIFVDSFGFNHVFNQVYGGGVFLVFLSVKSGHLNLAGVIELQKKYFLSI